VTTFLDASAVFLAALLPIPTFLHEGLPYGSPFPPPRGNWVIVTPVVLSDASLTIRGRLLVRSGGSLELHGVQLHLESDRHGDAGIEVEAGGSFTALRSTVTGRATRIDRGRRRGAYEFLVRSGGRLFLSEVELTGAGWDAEHPGLVVEGGPGERRDEAVLFGGEFRENHSGITLRGGEGDVVGSRFDGNLAAGVALERSQAVLSGVEIRREALGIRLADGSHALLDGATLLENEIALATRDGSPTIVRSLFAANRVHADVSGEGAPLFQDDVFVFARDAGVVVRDAAAPVVAHVDFARNAVAVRNERGIDGPAVDAADNYWGAADGPSGAGPGSGDPVTAGVLFVPWCTSSCVRDREPPG
jgi:hypothetical protein